MSLNKETKPNLFKIKNRKVEIIQFYMQWKKILYYEIRTIYIGLFQKPVGVKGWDFENYLTQQNIRNFLFFFFFVT